MDCLITFNRLPTHIEENPEEYAKKAKIPFNIFEKLLNEFTTITLKTQSRMHNENNGAADQEYKYVKSKEQ